MLRRFAVPVLALALLVPATPTVAAAGAGDVTITTLDVVVPAVSGGRVVAGSVSAGSDGLVASQVGLNRVTTEVATVDFQTVGVTWDDGVDGTALGVQVRSRVAGTWSGWRVLEVEPDPTDPGTAEGNRARQGTAPLWVGEADAVQLSFTLSATAISGINLVLVDVPVAQDMVGTAAATTSPATLGGLSVTSRDEWGARAPKCAMDTASTLTSAVVHHTAGSNNYADKAAAMRQIRGDQAYHMDGRGWCDLGYNFVVDKWGNVYEGRDGSLDVARVGVHASGWNTGTVGVSMLGDYSVVTPSATVQDAVARVIGARLGAFGVNPNTTFTYENYGYVPVTKMPSGFSTQQRVIGHRQAAFTTCPGLPAQNALPGIRAAAQKYAMQYGPARAVVTALYADILGRSPDPTGMATWSEMLASGSGGPALVTMLTRSDEYIQRRVTAAYREVLGRAPEPAGLVHWMERIRTGTATVDDVKRRFYDSDEYYARAGGTVEGYLRLLFVTMVNRDATTTELADWSALWARAGRTAVVDQLWFSLEAASYRSGGYYRTFLGREPDPAGQFHWAQVLLANGEGAVRVGIAGSQEYHDLAQVRFPS